MTDETSGRDFDEIDHAWMAEAARRYEAIRSGRARTLAHDEVVARLERRFGPTLSEAWKTELDRREAEYQDGRAELIDNDEALASLRPRLRDAAADLRDEQ